MCTPAEMLCDRGRQFIVPDGAGTTRFAEMLQAFGIRLRIAFRAQTKGKKEERINQFIERDFLDEVRWQAAPSSPSLHSTSFTPTLTPTPPYSS